MIIDAILGRKDALHYDAKSFYNVCMMYGEVGENITRAMDGGIEADVKDALKQYVIDNEYNPLICDYIDRVNWIRGTEPTVEKAAADEFNAACKARELDGIETVYAFEYGVLLSPKDDEFEFYANNNPDLPFGFYDENQGMFLSSSYDEELKALKEYVLNGVDGTYGVVSYQGQVDIGGTEYENLITGEYDIGNVSYTFFKNANEIVWSGCKVDGKLVEGFLEKAIIPKDKIVVAVLNDEVFPYPEEYTGTNLKEYYLFDTPDVFIEKWHELDEGSWYWVYANGDCVCSGAVDPGDIKIFEDYFDMTFEEAVDLYRFQVGDKLNYSGLYGGQYTSFVKEIQGSKMLVDTSWTAEDTGKTVTKPDSFIIEQDEEGNDCIVVWSYAGEKGLVYPPRSNQEPEKISVSLEDEIKEIAKETYELGVEFNSYDEFVSFCKENSVVPTKDLYKVYVDALKIAAGLNNTNELEPDIVYHCRAVYQHDNFAFADKEVKLQILSGLSSDCSLINFHCVEENKAEVSEDFPDDYIFTFEFYIKVPEGSNVDIKKVLNNVDGGELLGVVPGVPSLDELIKTANSKVVDSSSKNKLTKDFEL